MEDDKKILEEIREAPVDVPESLSPENITEYLKENGKSIRKREDARKVTRLRTFLCAAAAVLATAIVIPSLISFGKNNRTSSAESLAVTSGYEAGTGSSAESESFAASAPADTDVRGLAAASETAFDEAGQALIKRSEEAFAETSGTGLKGGKEAARIPLGELLQKASSYEQLKDSLGKVYNYYYDYDYGVYEFAEPKGLANGVDGRKETEAAEAPTATDSAASASSEHSGTNLREANVDEGDVVKTDGKFIYQVKNDLKIRIIRANGGSLEEVSVLEPSYNGSGDLLDMYLASDQLVLITYEKSSELSRDDSEAYYVNQKKETHVRTYELGDRTAPKEIGNVVLEGRYETSRITGGVVYVVTDKTQDRFYPIVYRNEPVRDYTLVDAFFDWMSDLFPELDNYSAAEYSERTAAESADEKTEEAFDEEEFLSRGAVPKVNGEYLKADSIYVPKMYSISRNWLISSVRLSDPTKVTDAEMICTDLSELYVSSNALFLIGSSEADYDGANVIRVDFADGAIRPTAAAYLPGTVDDSFSVSESGDGHFRAAVTRGWNGTNSVYVFDKAMNLTGSLENIIEGEEIKSARYIGNILYLVTYRNTDPLFSVDLSDPAAPKLLGELKIPGFSEYLHPYGDGRLLGLGYETDPKTGDTIGTKLSLFDVSDPSNVKELSKLVLRNVEPSVAFQNYKSVLADPGKNLFGFTANEAWWTYRWDDVVEYNEESFWITDEEGEENLPETLAKEGLAYVEDSAENAAESKAADVTSSANVEEGLVFTDGTTEAVSSEKKKKNKKAAEEDEDSGRTADVRMLGSAAYLLFSVKNDEIVCRLVRSLDETESGSRKSYYSSYDARENCRGIYIGDTFYVVEKNITAFSMTDGYKEIGQLA